MFEFEDISSGFHDVFLNKYADSSGPTLDFYISDSMQDMLDIDIRAEVATVVGGANEFTSLMNDLPSLDLEMGSNDGDISWLGGPKWSPSIGHTTVTTTTTGSANDIYADVGACVNPNSVMPVITSTILNATRSQVNLNTTNYNNNNRSNSPLPSPKEKKSHLTFSPNQIKVPSMQQDKINRTSQLAGNHQQQLLQQQQQQQQQHQNSLNNSQGLKSSIDNIKKDLSTELKDEKLIKTTIPNSMPTGIMSNANTIKLAPGIGGLTFANSLAYTKLKQSNLNLKSSANTNGSIGLQMKRERESSPHNNHINNNVVNGNSIYHNGTTNGHHNPPKMLARNIVVHSKSNGSVINAGNGMNIALANGTTMSHNGNGIPNGIATNGSGTNGTAISKNKIKSGNHEFPKPAYSYSCLIAMALKNSRSGSLPVSEIYSFMCEHFPYFKTAPNGWKNSVRHNLSLNKCFEKIEKPATNGGQRKGCLWAMNPTKISKMDEEVQKWSRKDPMAIRKAMVFPEHLEALERGEMKHGSTGDSDGENDVTSDVEENSDSEQDNEIDDQLIDENLVESQESVDDEDDPEKEYDIEVTDIYDSIDLNDDKEALRMAIRQNDYLEITENDLPIQSKRARLDINYSIGPARVFDNQIHQQQPVQQHQSRRKMQLVNRIV